MNSFACLKTVQTFCLIRLSLNFAASMASLKSKSDSEIAYDGSQTNKFHSHQGVFQKSFKIISRLKPLMCKGYSDSKKTFSKKVEKRC